MPAEATAPQPDRRVRRPILPSGFWRAFVRNVALVWLVAAAVHALLFIVVPGTAWYASELSLAERIGLLCLGAASYTPAAVVMAACVTVALRAVRSSRTAARPVLWTALGAALAADMFIRASWAMFYSTRRFIDGGAWSISAANPSLLLQHVRQAEPWILVAVPVSSVAIVSLFLSVCHLAASWPPDRTRRVVRSSTSLWLATIAIALGAQVLSVLDVRRVSPGPGRSRRSVREVYMAYAEDRTGAVASFLSQFWAALASDGPGPSGWSRPPSVGAPLLSPGEYARRVDARRARRLSVVLVMIESLRADELTELGSTRIVMPAVEAVAKEATLYTNAITQAAQSDYATTSALASQYPLRSDRFHPFARQLPYPRVLLWDLLRPLGYRTAVFSSQNEHWNGMYNFLSTGTVEHFLHAETFEGPKYVPSSDSGFRDWIAATGHAGKIDDRYTIDEAIAWTDSIAPGAPFLAYVNLQSSHTPYQRPPGFAPRFGSGRVSFPILFNSYPEDSSSAVRSMYENSLAYSDAQLGRLINALKRSGRWDSTVLVIMGDHGEGFYEHDFAGHASELYREVTHIPLLIRVPRVAARRDSVAAASIDVAPTVLGILGLPPHPAFQGVDLADTTARQHRPIFSLSQTPLADEIAVTQDGWELVLELRHSETRLFDLRSDPTEMNDVDERYPEQSGALMGTIATWWTTQLEYYRSPDVLPRFYPPPAPRPSPLAPAPAS